MPKKKQCRPAPKMSWEKGMEKGIDEVKKIGEEALDKIKALKGKYDQLDLATKKKIGAAVAGLAALTFGAAVAKKAISKKRK